MRDVRPVVAFLLLLLPALMTCRRERTTGPSAPVRVDKVAGDGQAGLAGQALGQELGVQVVDGGGHGVAGVLVQFTPDGGTVSPDSARSDANGFAQTQWTLPFVAGTYSATAKVSGLPPATFSAIVQDQPVSHTTQTIGSSGGTVSLPVGGTSGSVQVQVPPGALPSGSSVSLAILPVPSGALPAGASALAPLVAVSGPAVVSDSIMVIRIPVSSAKVEVAAAYEIVDANNTLRPVLVLPGDSSSIRLGVRTLSAQTPAAVGGIGARATASDARQFIVTSPQVGGPDLIETDFLPGRDDWEFTNQGSAIVGLGQCWGQVETMFWYFLERRLRQNAPTLYDRYSRIEGFPWYEYDNRGFRLASVVAADLNAKWLPAVWLANASKWVSWDSRTWGLIVDNVATSGRPAELVLWNGSDVHSVLGWRVERSTGTIWVADPNHPGEADRKIHYSAASKKFDSYDGYGTITFYPVDPFDWWLIGTRWAEFDAGVIGTRIPHTFPSAPVTRVDDGSTVTDGSLITIASNQLRLQVPSGFVMSVYVGNVEAVSDRARSLSLPVFASSGLLSALTFDQSINAIDFLQFTVVAMPADVAINPGFGPLSGGTGVTITGVNLFGIPSVTIGGNRIGNLIVFGNTRITGSTPESGTPGPKDVVVTTRTGSSTCAGCFVYEPAP